MSFNPYYTDDADDDLFEDTDVDDSEVHGHALDGTTCRKCYRAHSTDGLPEDGPALDQTKAMMRMLPESMLLNFLNEQDFNSHIPTRIAYGWLKGSAYTQESGSPEAFRRAVAGLLDEMTGGRMTAMWKVYEAERQLITNHAVLRFINETLEWMRTKNVEDYPERNQAKFLASLHVTDFICELLVERTVSTYNKYKLYCAEADVEPQDESAIVSLRHDSEEIDDPIMKVMLKKLEIDMKTRF